MKEGGMLLALDIGNTHTVVGVFAERELCAHWRLATRVDRTADELAALLRQFFALAALKEPITAAVVASVVPDATGAMIGALRRWFDLDPLLIGPSTETGMAILYENPQQVGADRIVNAVAAYAEVNGGAIVVDFGTATTFDCITPQGDYLGGVIAPGLGISADALHARAAQLPRVAVARPARVIGKDTVGSMQAGLFYGYVGLVDEIVRQIKTEAGFPMRVIATGGLAHLMAGATKAIDAIDELLTLKGLKILYGRNA